MASTLGQSQPAQKNSALPIVIAVAVFAVVAGLAVFFFTRADRKAPDAGPTPEARAYLPNLQLGGVTLKAAENLMKQQVVYVDGQITNKGPRRITRIDLACIFTDPNGQEVHRERATIVNGSLNPGQTRPFELAFESLPDSWDQALPRFVIAAVHFAN